MKDIVDRNCDIKEEEIQALVPVPLYLGLVGTMLGILVGIGFLLISGGLNDLLKTGNDNGLEGIVTLLGGVALAMISSICGIILTTLGSHHAKNAKKELEKNKNSFLSWIQAELLPNLSTDVSIALVKMSQNLVEFNNTFSQNTNNLKIVLEEVTHSYQKQKELMQYINQLNINEIATANIQVYNKLKNCTKEIGVFSDYLLSVNEYLSNIQLLNKKLDDYEKRTQVIEDAGNFYKKNEKWLAENIDSVNIEIKRAIENFEESTNKYLLKLQESFSEQILKFDRNVKTLQEKLIENLDKTSKMYQDKLNEMSIIVDEIKSLSHIKEGIKEFKDALNRQNLKIDELIKEIHYLASVKSGNSAKTIIRFPKWINILIISGISIVLISCLFYVIPLLIELITKFKSLFF